MKQRGANVLLPMSPLFFNAKARKKQTNGSLSKKAFTHSFLSFLPLRLKKADS